ncbi:hypothetical protein [Fulvimarina sp. MAC3]|uniref:hypothetical protein n=1 Tax=Fulvimarina sp. MAC3 TaxID=3148887 RepID=UPI0031FC6E3F
MFDTSSPWLRPLWRRLLITAITLAWGIFEAVNGNTFWALVFLGSGAWLAWSLIMTYEPKTVPSNEKHAEKDET